MKECVTRVGQLELREASEPTRCWGPFGGLHSVSGVTLIKWYCWFAFNYSKPSVSTFTSADPSQLGNGDLVLVVPLNWTEPSQSERVGSGSTSISQVYFKQNFEAEKVI